ncbi:MAG TPA: hypothetical protein VF376_04110 [Thermoanaerobaculia bacterium]
MIEPRSHAAPPEADPDVVSIDGILRALYEVVSGPAGPRDWKRERKLFLPEANLMPSGNSPAGGTGRQVFDLDGYIASRSSFFEKNDFYEIETARRTFVFGDKAQVLSAYEGRRTPDGSPFLRGINGIQLFYDGRRWWVLSIAWDNETPNNPLPDLP